DVLHHKMHRAVGKQKHDTAGMIAAEVGCTVSATVFAAAAIVDVAQINEAVRHGKFIWMFECASPYTGKQDACRLQKRRAKTAADPGIARRDVATDSRKWSRAACATTEQPLFSARAFTHCDRVAGAIGDFRQPHAAIAKKCTALGDIEDLHTPAV